MRLSSHAYTLDTMNYYVHLTNNAVQCNSKNYGALIKGNIFSLSELESHYRLLENEKKTCDVEIYQGYFFDQIKHSMLMCFDATHELINKKARAGCFELFGFDFMIDERYHVWLIECNSCPSLDESNPFLTTLLTRMAGKNLFDEDDMFKLTIDRAFPPPSTYKEFAEKPSAYPLLGYSNDEILWDKLRQY